MYKIQHVTIYGFGQDKTVDIAFEKDINILIGKNGTGKTRFINIVQSILNADYLTIVNSDFSSCIIRLTNESNSIRTVKVIRTETESFDIKITYKIGTKSSHIIVPGFYRDTPSVSPQIRRRLNAAFDSIRSNIRELVETSSISVNRDGAFSLEIDPETPTARLSPNNIDRRLSYLLERLRGFQLELSDLAGQESLKFQHSVLSLMLFDPKLDRYTLDNVASLDLSDQKEKLYKAYKELGAFNSTIQKKIDEHIKSLRNSVEKIKAQKFEDINDFFPIPLLARTRLLLEMSSNADKNRQIIFSPIESYISLIKSFMSDKSITISSDGSLNISQNKRKIPTSDLSSGEKQVLIILTESLLQKGRPCIFFADEPEISLHIEWQSKILEALSHTNPNAQIIVATHSPEIAAGRKHGLISMSKVTHG